MSKYSDKNVHPNFSKSKVITLNVFFCPKPKEMKFNMI